MAVAHLLRVLLAFFAGVDTLFPCLPNPEQNLTAIGEITPMAAICLCINELR